MKVLIIQTAFIGDVVLSTPLIESIKAQHTDADIQILVRKRYQSLFEKHPHLSQVLTLDKSKRLKESIRLVKYIRSQSFDYVINVQRFATTGLLTCLSGASKTVGFDKNPLSSLFSHRISHSISKEGLEHEVDRNSKLLEPLDIKSIRKPRLYPSKKDYDVVPQEEYVCIAPSSKWKTKEWPISKWIQLVDALINHFKVYLIGAKEDVPACEIIKTQSKSDSRVEVMAGELTMLQSVALIEKATMTFSNDSAPMHFASAVNAPITAIYCSTVPAFGFGPLSEKSVVIETHNQLDCRPCGLHGKKECPKGHFQCGDIEVKKVLRDAGMLNY